MVKDLNKDIEGLSGEGIQYNHLNLPFKVQVKKNATEEKGNIKYIYDASGVKLRKITTEAETTVTHNGSQYTTSIISTTDYIGGFIYESKSYSNTNLASLAYSNKLQFFAHEEGRTRPKEENNEITFVYDYFIKDHLGNVRMVLTEEEKTITYPPASMEMAQSATEEALYANVSTTRDDLPSGYPTTDNITNPNEKVAKVLGNNNPIGPSITLKVMAGDKFNIHVSSWYKTNSVTPDNPVNILNDLITSLTTGISAQLPSFHQGVTALDLQNTGIFSPSMTEFFNNHQNPDACRPKAYLNWILFDEQFKYVGSSSGAQQVPAESAFGTAPNNDVHHHVLTDLPITKNGYLYIYVSNETPNIAVYFDNLQVTHTPGPLLEETNYYPFGLIQQGISSKAAGMLENKQKFMGKEQQSKEFSDGSGLEWNDFGARMFDPQIGRWNHIDPKSEKYMPVSPYSFTSNNPILFIDQAGKDVTPSTGFKSSSYYAMYQKLSTSNSVYKSYLAPFVDNKQMNYNLDAGSVKKAGDKALATTQPKDWNNDIKKDGFGMVTAINTTTTTWQVNEKADITTNGVTETKGINDAGRALVLLHEGAHAFLQSIAGDAFHTDMTNPIAGGEHDMMASGGYQKDILKGLTELRDAGGITMSDANLTNLSFYGLQGTDGFDKQFGITVTDRKSQEYADAVKKVYADTLNPLIYTEKNN
jgi:RHS repeat-associated protein